MRHFLGFSAFFNNVYTEREEILYSLLTFLIMEKIVN